MCLNYLIMYRNARNKCIIFSSANCAGVLTFALFWCALIRHTRNVCACAYIWFTCSRLRWLKVSRQTCTKMTLHHYFKKALPTPEETGLTEKATREANQAVAAVLQESTNTTSTSRKRSYLVFSDQQRATISQYVAVNGKVELNHHRVMLQVLL